MIATIAILVRLLVAVDGRSGARGSQGGPPLLLSPFTDHAEAGLFGLYSYHARLLWPLQNLAWPRFTLVGLLGLVSWY